jgi:hypothetical protein
MRIDEKIIRSGYFWLPGKKDNKISGTLSIIDGGELELEIVGHFTGDFDALGDDTDLSRIVGTVEKSGFVTLENCFYRRKNHSFGGISKSKIHVGKLFTRVAYDENEIPLFNTFSFSVDCLDEWVNICGADIKHDWEGKTATIDFSLPNNIVVKLKDSMALSVCFSYSHQGSATPTGVEINQNAYFKLSSNDLLPLNDFISVARKITNLMCLAMDATVTLRDVVATSSLLEIDRSNGETTPVNVEIFYPSLPYAEKNAEKKLYQMLFGFKAIDANFEQIVNNWLTGYESLMPALNLYFSTKQGAYKYLEGNFLSLSQGLETYHRRVSNETLMEHQKYESLMEGLLKSCPDEHKTWLEGRLQHGNEINLRKRITRIIEPFKSYLGNSVERRKLINSIVDTRNYLTHYDESLKDQAVDGRQLHALSQKMEAMFQLHFLKLLGFTNEQITSVIDESYTLKAKLDQ